jgi:predicted RNase H-like HicB family nuclease
MFRKREAVMKQQYHSIIRSRHDGSYIGWVEEVPGTITRARTMEECREKLRESLLLIIETNRAEARLWLDSQCIEETVELDVPEYIDRPSRVVTH